MDIIQVIVLALIQGITEFLPISSSAHLILPSEVLGWPDQGLAFDVAVHVGTLAAVLMYFRRDVQSLLVGWFGQFGGRGYTHEARLGWAIIVATIPAGLVGLLFKDFIELHLRSISVIASTTVLFGLLLGWADIKAKETRDLMSMTLTFALVIGLAQALALIPGTSRSGITITAAIMLGFIKQDAARFSFLMSIPVILLSGLIETMELLEANSVAWIDVLIGASISAISAYLCIHFFLKAISKLSMMPFVVYRLLLGAVLFGIILAG